MPLAAKFLIGLVALAALVAGVTHWRASAREAEAETRYPPLGQMIDLPGGPVHAVVMGSGPDLVLIHGSNGNVRDMTYALAPALAERYRVIILDRPGLGYSPARDADGDSLADQARALRDAAQALGAHQPIVMGQSYGGAVALAWAVHYPDSIAALVPLAAASNPWGGPLDPLYRVTSTRLGQAVVVPLITAFVSTARVNDNIASVFEPQPAPPDYGDHIGVGLTLRRAPMRANALQRRDILTEITALQPRYGQITVPTEIVHGTADDIVPLHTHSAKLVHQIPGAVLTELPGIGHMPHQVAVPQVVAAIDRAAARSGLR
ncbi:MAG: alpha/beta hydrolase [Marinibacterium sp.]|nr:alpha/beta hydrolase [Marinibacterium sp.]